ncbi:MAG: hypothetical protein HKN43_15120, partial [Rhodothermales bacterium]|nr:hypothetical protein [Rhodothermales bacterium]
MYSDSSDDGLDPDPDGDGNPDEDSSRGDDSDENDPTPVILDGQSIALAKRVVATRQVAADAFEVDFSLIVANLSPTQDATNVQVTDDLAVSFAGADSIAVVSAPLTGTLTSNPDPFDGIDNINLLSGMDLMAPLQADTISFTAYVRLGSESSTFENQARTTTSDSLGTVFSEDLSNDGNDVDPSGDGNGNSDPDACLSDPSSLTCENTPTPVVFNRQVVGIAKEVTDVRAMGDSIFEVDFSLIVENLSGVAQATNVLVTDDLAETFPGVASTSVVGSPELGSFSDPDVAFDGIGNIALTSGTDTLDAGQIETVLFTVRVDVSGAAGPFVNQAVVATYGTPGGEILSSDLSDAGTEPDANGNGDPADGPGPDGTGDENDATLVPIVGENLIKLSKIADRSIATIGQFVTYTLEAENLTSSQVTDVTIVDDLPGGLYFVEGSAILVQSGSDGKFYTSDDVVEDLLTDGKDPVEMPALSFAPNEILQIRYIVRIGATAVEGSYENLAQPFVLDLPAGNQASVVIEVTPDPTFEQSTIVGKVFHDSDRDGVQDYDEEGIPGARIVTAEGLIIQTDEFGRYHIADIDAGRWERGRNFIAKLDLASVPRGAVATTENPRVERVTQGILSTIDFGVALPDEDLQAVRYDDEWIDVNMEMFFDYDKAEIREDARGDL